MSATTAACRTCNAPVKKKAQLCDAHAPRRSKIGHYARTCVRCGKEFKRRKKQGQKYCSSFCRNEQNIADKLQRGKTAVIPNKKICKTCLLSKPAHKFCINAYSTDGLRSRCRDCDKTYNAQWRVRNPNYRDVARAKNLARNFGITVDEYDSLLVAQGGVCAYCGKPPAEGKKRLAVDHDHRSGEIRGLLHAQPCNKNAVGYHDLSSARALLNYLETPPARAFFGGPRIAERSKDTGRKRSFSVLPLKFTVESHGQSQETDTSTVQNLIKSAA